MVFLFDLVGGLGHGRSLLLLLALSFLEGHVLSQAPGGLRKGEAAIATLLVGLQATQVLCVYVCMCV